MAATLTNVSQASLIKWIDRTVMGLLYLTMLLIPVFFIIYTRDQFELPKLTILRITTSLMLGLWGIRLLVGGKWVFRRTPLDLPILIWAGYQVFTTIFSVSSHVSFMGEYENFRGLLTVINYALLYFIAVNFIRTRAQIDRLLLVIFIAGLLVTSYGIAQFFGIDFIKWNPNSIAPGRYFSTLGNPNFLAAFLAMVMPLTIVFFIETKSIFRRCLLFVSFITMFWALLGTNSRGGLLGLLVALAILIGFVLIRLIHNWAKDATRQHRPLPVVLRDFISQHKPWLALIALVLIIIITISATFGRNHLVRMTDSIVHAKEAITRSRLYIWGPALKMIGDYPFFGTGLDTFKTVFPRYAPREFAQVDGANVSSRTAHNEVLQVLACQGVVGFIIVTWLTLMILLNWRKAYLRAQTRWRDRLILLGLLASWAAYSTQNVFSFGVVAIDSFYWLIIALIVLLQSSPEDQAPAPLPVQANSSASLLPNYHTLRLLGMILIIIVSGWLSMKALSVARADYYYNLGSVFRMQKQLKGSQYYFGLAAAMVPLEVKYRVYYGLAHEELAKSASALPQKIAWIEKAIEIYGQGQQMNPTNAYYLGNLGRAYGFAATLVPDNETYHNQAVRYFKEAIHYAPVTVLFYVNLAMTHLVRREEDKFFEVLDQLSRVDISEAARVAFNAGNQFYHFNLIPQAARYYQKALDYKSDYVEALFNLGVISSRLGDRPQALEYWQQILTIKPNYQPALQMLQRYEQNRQVKPSTVIIGD